MGGLDNAMSRQEQLQYHVILPDFSLGPPILMGSAPVKPVPLLKKDNICNITQHRLERREGY